MDHRFGERMISVIIPNLNGRIYLDPCLRSLRRQSHKDFETILVDNGSEDGSVQWVEHNFPEVRVVRFDSNKGFSVAVNAGIRASTGEYIALLNNDTEADPNWLLELKRALDLEEEVGFCASKVLFYDRRDLINSAGDVVTASGYAWNLGFHLQDRGEFNREKLVFGASGAAAIYRREMFEDVGLFDEDYFAYYEDVDLSFRAQLKGYKCRYVPRAVVYHRLGGTTRRESDLAIYYTERNVLFNLVKDVPIRIVLPYCFKIIRHNVYKFFGCLFKGQFPMWLEAKLSAFPHLFKMMKKRQEIQRGRRVSISYIRSILGRGRIPWF